MYLLKSIVNYISAQFSSAIIRLEIQLSEELRVNYTIHNTLWCDVICLIRIGERDLVYNILGGVGRL
jgi:hypothetical protein